MIILSCSCEIFWICLHESTYVVLNICNNLTRYKPRIHVMKLHPQILFINQNCPRIISYFWPFKNQLMSTKRPWSAFCDSPDIHFMVELKNILPYWFISNSFTYIPNPSFYRDVILCCVAWKSIDNSVMNLPTKHHLKSISNSSSVFFSYNNPPSSSSSIRIIAKFSSISWTGLLGTSHY